MHFNFLFVFFENVLHELFHFITIFSQKNTMLNLQCLKNKNESNKKNIIFVII